MTELVMRLKQAPSKNSSQCVRKLFKVVSCRCGASSWPSNIARGGAISGIGEPAPYHHNHHFFPLFLVGAMTNDMLGR